MKAPKRKTVSAVELIARLKNDPDWVRRNDERERRRQSIERQLRENARPLLNDLAAVGYTLGSVWDLVNTKVKYPLAIPVLVTHLSRPYHSKNLEGIARALTVAEARGGPAATILAELQRRADDAESDVRWALANALTVVGDASMVPKIEAMLNDSRYSTLKNILELALRESARRPPIP